MDRTTTALPSAITAHYETLRLAALGEPLPPEARSGLTLFVRRGMWGWARAATASSVRAEPAAASSADPRVVCERKAVIDVLASLAVRTQDRRAS